MIKLKEMPWYNVQGKDFDLELENFKSGKDFIEYLTLLFKGKKMTDKFKNTLQLKTIQDKRELCEVLKSSMIFNAMRKGKFTNSENNLLDIILDM